MERVGGVWGVGVCVCVGGGGGPSAIFPMNRNYQERL